MGGTDAKGPPVPVILFHPMGDSLILDSIVQFSQNDS